MKADKKRLIRLLTAFGIGLAVFVGICLYRGVFAAQDTVQLLKWLSDAAFVPGALLICVGALVFCNNHGALDGISYGFKVSIHALIPMTRYPGKFGDYRQARMDKEKVKIAEFFIAGGVFLLAAIILTLCYEAAL